MNSKLDWNDNLASIFETKLTFNRPPSSVSFNLGAVDTIFLGMYRDLRLNVMVYELVT